MKNLTQRELLYLIARESRPTIWEEAQRAVKLAVSNRSLLEIWHKAYDDKLLQNHDEEEARSFADSILKWFERGEEPYIWYQNEWIYDEGFLDRYGATVEDSEPANNFGFLKEPHDELYPAVWEGMQMREDARDAILDHVIDALAKNGYRNAGEFINFSVYGSGASYNWDEDGDFDVQMWVDADKYNSLSGRVPMTADELVTDIRRIVQPINFPSFADLGLADEKSEGKMLVQYYPKPGTGSKDENLASKPYACFDLETAQWYQTPKKITPEFYGDYFIMVEPKAQDIATQASAVLESLERNTVEWSFWSAMYESYKKDEYQTQAEQARADAERDREGANNLFLNIFQGRSEAYSPEGKGSDDERDLLEKLLEVWGIFQRLRSAARSTFPWEEQELPKEEEADDGDESEGKTSKYYDGDQDVHWSIVADGTTLEVRPIKTDDYVYDFTGDKEKGLANDANLGWIVLDRGETIGSLTGWIGHSDIEVADLWVEPTYRNTPAAMMLFSALLQKAKELGLDVDPGIIANDRLEILVNKWRQRQQRTARTPERLSETVHEILSNGGGTFNLDLSPVSYHDGYYSSVHGYEQTISEEEFGESTLAAYIDTVEGHPDYLLGTWVDEGLVYIDLTKHIPDRSTAIEFGIYNDQKAIWDIAADKAIVLDEEPYEPQPAFAKIAAWKDLMEKAKRLKDQGRIHILNNQPEHVVGRVEGDHGTYTTQIWREDPNSSAITMWDCECPWDQYAWQRTRQWKKYEGRPCSHTLALFWTAQATAPQVSPEQMTIPGTTPPMQAPPPTPYAPGQPNLEGQGLPRPGVEPEIPRGPWEPTPQQPLQPGMPPVTPPVAPGMLPTINTPQGMPVDPRVLRTAPGAPQQIDPRVQPPVVPGGNSTPQEAGEGGQLGFPGAFSHWKQAAFENGTIVRAEVPLVGVDRDGHQWRIKRNSKGEVLSSDDDQTIAIFPLSTGRLEPHLVRVVAETTAFSQSSGSPFIGR